MGIGGGRSPITMSTRRAPPTTDCQQEKGKGESHVLRINSADAANFYQTIR